MKIFNCRCAAAAALAGAALLHVAPALAKLPAPSEEAKANADEAAAKTNWGTQTANFQLCKSMDQVAATYTAQAKKAGKDIKPVVATPACADPGTFVYVPAAPASAATDDRVARIPYRP